MRFKTEMLHDICIFKLSNADMKKDTSLTLLQRISSYSFTKKSRSELFSDVIIVVQSITALSVIISHLI